MPSPSAQLLSAVLKTVKIRVYESVWMLTSMKCGTQNPERNLFDLTVLSFTTTKDF